MFSKKKGYLVLAGLVLLGLLALPGMAAAETEIRVTIDDPDHPHPNGQQEGNTIYNVLSSPQVSYGENRELGTVRASGKPGIAVPVRQGQKVRITLPYGISYMQTPDADNYKNYVEWPSSIDGQANQIADKDGHPGMKFISGSPRSLTLQVESLNTAAPIMALDFVFNKANYSTVRVAPFLKDVDTYRADTGGPVSRLEFFKLLIDVNIPFSSVPLLEAANKTDWEDWFSDLNKIADADLAKITPLLATGWVSGYPDGKLLADQAISRAEAAALAGKVFAHSGQKAGFKDAIPAWAATGIDSAVSGGIVVGYPDGSFQAERLLNKAEALSIIQNCLESYSRK